MLAVSACAPGSRISDTDWLTADELLGVRLSIDSTLLAPRFEDAIWAAHVVDMESGRVLYSRNARKNLIPASGAKLFTTATALETLGPEFRFETVLYADGEIRGDTLFGDLVVHGSGDPTLSDRYMDDPLSVFRSWADSLLQAGVRVVTGGIIGDATLFDGQRLGAGWNWDNEQYYYSAQISALSFFDNCVFVTAAPTSAGQPATVSWEPRQTSYVSVENRTVTVERGDRLLRRNLRPRGQNSIVAYSRVPVGRSARECVTVEDPARFAAHVLVETVRDAGIEIAGGAQSRLIPQVPEDFGTEVPAATNGWFTDVEHAPPTPTRIARHVSPPLSRIAYQVNKESENLDAELLLRSVGAYAAPVDTTVRRGSASSGVAHVKSIIAAAGGDTTYIGQVDGSGLSRKNLVTPLNVTHILRYMARHPNAEVAEAFVASLPIGGLDGTLRSRYADGAPARHQVAAKTGTMTFISSLSGYINTASERTLVFSLICNN
ncbi:MAG: D-alanyl-D-alanine carboxypeptidase/D-alanyl-D-alanine-endopeptidase, partial [Rhodothermales bacterium]|nr:D-alanyl-D-alanine carboxypeptidase/D-alanyl-D-alanine-endopeptidase [Rhodothermales bacterium]